MIKRMYYTDPIKAAYMAKEFGVRIYLDIPKKDGKSTSSIDYIIEAPNLGTNRFEAKIYPKTDGSGEYETNWKDTGQQEYLTSTNSDHKFYIAKESESIFEPKADDFGLGHSKERGGAIIPVIVRSHNKEHDSTVVYYPGRSFYEDKFQITMRDEKHFIMPELEK